MLLQSNFLRPLSAQQPYFNQQVIQELPQQVPYKFRSGLHPENYVKKPKKFQQPEPVQQILQPVQIQQVTYDPVPLPPIEHPIQQSHFVEPVHEPVLEPEPATIMPMPPTVIPQKSFCSGLFSRCTGVFQNCRQRQGHEEQIPKSHNFKLKNYPIRTKDLSQLHFQNCQCAQCSPQRMQEGGANLGQMQESEMVEYERPKEMHGFE